jgi:hypothetical protein
MVKFVDYYVAFGGRNQTQAAISAGYSPTGAQAIASRLLRRPDVLRLLHHITETTIKADILASAETLRMIRDSGEAPVSERRKAASELLDRAGMLIAKVSEHHVTVDHVNPNHMGRHVEGLIALRQYAEQSGMTVTNQMAWDEAMRVAEIMNRQDAEQRKVVDAEWEEVQAIEHHDAGREGLEDLL